MPQSSCSSERTQVAVYFILSLTAYFKRDLRKQALASLNYVFNLLYRRVMLDGHP